MSVALLLLSTVFGLGFWQLGAARPSDDLKALHTVSPHHGTPGHENLRCDLCADNWLFILAAGGRTGSTTSLSMFNSVPSFELSGEHWAALSAKLVEFELLKKAEGLRFEARHSGHRVDWLAMKCNVQQLTKDIIFGNSYEALANNTRVLGFKEIRYTTVRMLRFLSEVFPCARMVFPLRLNPDAEVHAQEFRRPSVPANKIWQEASVVVNEVHERLPDIASLMPVETLSLSHFNHVLHAKLGVRGCSFARIIHDNANGGYAADHGTGPVMSGECDFSHLDFRLTESQIQKNREQWAEMASDSRFEGFIEPGMQKFQDLYQNT
mmetsp:Transcript_7406/g.20922  ORF Transcript_7406/g.20922 Transcript_7406/m.20922 type:complete len:323 (-) Transcript_7406:108-1076(-)